MATGTVLTVAQTLLAALQCSELRELCSIFGYKTDLEDLERTASTIRAVLLDAASKQEVQCNEAQDWINKLKDAVYDVDDLLDEFYTIVQRNKLQEQTDGGQLNKEFSKKQTDGGKMMKKLSKKVCRFFSRSNQFIVAFNMTLDVKKIRKKLNAIASDHSKFGFSSNYEPIKWAKKESCSYVDEGGIIGREGDKDAVVALLLQDHPTIKENVSFVTVVGMGGLGKTALAQLVYDDDRIKNGFESRLWVCVSVEFGMKEILSKMLMSATNQKCDNLGFDQIQMKVREKIRGQRYLLVLDDVWCESRKEWIDLKGFLNTGGKGSRVLVTTRSKLVARATGNSHHIHDLKGLSQEDSWRLFVQMAFDNGGEEADAKLVEIGQEIVKKCVNVPLSIRVTGSMLYGQEMRKWQLFKEVNLSKIRHGNDDTMAILKFSYNHLNPSLKSCFSYCALFPKDCAIQKDHLINLWLTHGCIEPQYDERQSLQDVGEEYFSILLDRCFFQEVRIDYSGDIYECKMHDLIHDLAQEVAGNELLSWSGGHFNWKLRHLSISKTCCDLFNQSECVDQVKTTRTFLIAHPTWKLDKLVSQLDVPLIVSNCRYLRVLDLRGSSIEILSSEIGELVHLRYLELCGSSSLKMVPNSITKLHNLQVMGLGGCYNLVALPEDLSKLVNLRVLDIDRCSQLTHMPAGMDKLTSLHKLTMFVVGETNSKQIKVSHLVDLQALVQLGGNLTIKLGKYASEFMEGRYPLIKSRLKSLVIEFPFSLDEIDGEEALLEGLQPNDGLKEIKILGYGSAKLPSWASMGSSLRIINLEGLYNLRYLPSMRQLGNLKLLILNSINSLEYMEESNIGKSSAPSSSVPREDTTFKFFPSLEELILHDMRNLKGWWRSDITRADGVARSCPSEVEGDDDAIVGSSRDKEQAAISDANEVMQPVSSLLFPSLRKLDIRRCPNLTSFPSCPHVQELHLLEVNQEFSFSEKIRASTTPINSCTKTSCVEKQLETDKVGGYKNCLLEEFSQGVVSLHLTESKEESLSTIETIKFFQNCASSLLRLEIYNCGTLKSTGRGVFEHLTNLQSLDINGCDNLAFEDDDDDGIPWKSLESLSSLCLQSLPKLVNIPKGIQYLIALRSFEINNCANLASLPESLSCLTSLGYLSIMLCPNLKSLPEAMRRLPSLSRLDIINCYGLMERCRGPNGEDWPKIRHIPSLSVISY